MVARREGGEKVGEVGVGEGEREEVGAEERVENDLLGGSFLFKSIDLVFSSSSFPPPPTLSALEGRGGVEGEGSEAERQTGERLAETRIGEF